MHNTCNSLEASNIMLRRTSLLLSLLLILASFANAQKAEVTVSLNEAFFDALLDSIYQNFDPPQFSIAQNEVNRSDAETQRSLKGSFAPTTFIADASAKLISKGNQPFCDESIKILREANGVRTAVRFREGKIYVPLAFSGNYNPPLIGCVEFGGWAEANLDLEFDRAGQRLIGRVRVLNVSLNGTGGVGGTVIAKMLQGSIDRKLNPIEILSLEKVSFGVPVQKNGNLRMKAVGMRPELANGLLNVVVEYQFLKG